MIKILDNLIEINNFGPINYSFIDCSKFIVLTGNNNSGKSFTTLLIHSLSNILENTPDIVEDISNLSSNSLKYFIENSLSFDFKNTFNEYLNDISNLNSMKIPIKDFEDVVNLGIGVVFADLVENRLKDVFGVNTLDKLIRGNCDYFSLKFAGIEIIKKRNENLKIYNLLDFFNFSEKLINKLIGSSFKISKDDSFYHISFLNIKTLKSQNFNNVSLVNEFYFEFSKYFFKNLEYNHSFYIPSAREDLLKIKNSILSKNLKENYNLSFVQKNLLRNILENEDNLQKGKYYDLARIMENELLNGEVKLKKVNSNFKFYYYPLDSDLEISSDLFSSSINELIPIIFYLKYILGENDCLVIEEPEAHLHPKNQRKLVKYLVEMVNNGLNIIITTHSDYISDQLNNHIVMFNIIEDVLKNDFNYLKEDALDYKSLSIYNYKANSLLDVSVEKILINSTGFIETNFEEVNSSLYDEVIKLDDAKKVN